MSLNEVKHTHDKIENHNEHNHNHSLNAFTYTLEIVIIESSLHCSSSLRYRFCTNDRVELYLV